ncbi:glycosyltransferase family 4 protein [Marinobacter orientalis]|uniref:Glycosyltransferase family 4 protein n=1 Tax=Marinobacter orientalis TaxID=1928859 RepID=A0A7Y0RCN8_9GAMM|nr:glycosyltransferase family 4 protein [Marinobacter orientalis]NMT63785.1 glycosyltransferase family 4 protein [Marinobacter orientalis]TGX49894.1 glycosyltransferase [Marinobacter orientalis]
MKNVLMTALQPGGGIKTFFRYVYGQENFKNYEFTLVAPDHGLGEYLRDFLPSGRIRLETAETGSFAFIRQVRSLVRKGDFQLVHSHGFSAGALTEFAIMGLNQCHLMTAHDVFNQAQFQRFKGRFKHILMSAAFKRMDAIHTVTDDARNNFLDFFPAIGPERIHGILHGIDTAYFREGCALPLRKTIGLSPDTPLIGFFGRFMGQKGFRQIVDAIDLIRTRRLMAEVPHVATFGWGGFIREDYAYLGGLGLCKYFHQMPQTDNMAGSIKGVDLVVMPSRWEACGLLAMEALTAGVPIIGSDCIGLREVLDGSPAQQVSVGDTEALAAAIIREFQDIDSRRGEFKRYQEVAVSRFSIERPARELALLYSKLNDQG